MPRVIALQRARSRPAAAVGALRARSRNRRPRLRPPGRGAVGRAAVRGDPAVAGRLPRALRRAVPARRARPDGPRGLSRRWCCLLVALGLLPARTRSSGRHSRRSRAGSWSGFAIGIKPSNGLFVAAPIAAALSRGTSARCCPFALALVPALADARGVEAAGTRLAAAVRASKRPVSPLGSSAAVPVVDRYLDERRLGRSARERRRPARVLLERAPAAVGADRRDRGGRTTLPAARPPCSRLVLRLSSSSRARRWISSVE